MNATGVNTCKKCATGMFSAVCALGSEDASPGATHAGCIVCKDCPVGRFAANEATPSSDDLPELTKDCQTCPGGWKQPTEGKNNCARCALGQFAVVCATGSEDAGLGSTHPGCIRCKDCALGQYAQHYARTACTNCPRGRFGDQIALEHPRDANRLPRCKSCVKGTYNEQLGQISDAACVDCPVGLYLDTTNDDNFANNGGTNAPFGSAASCTEQGHHWSGTQCLNLDNDRVADCKSCPAGRYGNVTGLVDKDARTAFPSSLNDTYCKPCPAGKYLTDIGATGIHKCLDCPRGKYLPKAGQTLLSDCLDCPVGRYSDTTGVIGRDDKNGRCSLMSRMLTARTRLSR